MLYKKDSIHGHVIVDTPSGPVYEDDGTPVDANNPRRCKGCGAHIVNGEQDPCIANLPSTHQACCGHGLECTPLGQRPNGYVALVDGRSFRFSGLVGGERIRAAVDAAVAGEPLPDGFTFDPDRMWWEGLSAVQRAYVQDRITTRLACLVRDATHGSELSEAIINGTAMWHEGLDDKQKEQVLSNMQAMLAALVQEAVKSS